MNSSEIYLKAARLMEESPHLSYRYAINYGAEQYVGDTVEYYIFMAFFWVPHAKFESAEEIILALLFMSEITRIERGE